MRFERQRGLCEYSADGSDHYNLRFVNLIVSISLRCVKGTAVNSDGPRFQHPRLSVVGAVGLHQTNAIDRNIWLSLLLLSTCSRRLLRAGSRGCPRYDPGRAAYLADGISDWFSRAMAVPTLGEWLACDDVCCIWMWRKQRHQLPTTTSTLACARGGRFCFSLLR